jgi:prolyl 4-hydroxylase
MERQIITPSIFTISNALTVDECGEMIRLASEKGFDAATINTWSGPRLDRDTRSNDRVIVDDFDLTQRIWTRIEEFIPRVKMGRQSRGLNERIRFYRYMPGQRFSWHADAPFSRENGELSLLTFMIYLNEEYKGGATKFESLQIEGKRGMALVFEHGLIHEGAEVTEGVKYVLRSDVMYGRIGQTFG